MQDTIRVCTDIPKEVHSAIEAIAKKERRSLHKQLAHILEEYARGKAETQK